ncbi:transmembrane protein [Achlya hypogyna]|uniref:Transmembrane protein n=1 Tax=Achlya hypogyna TaxID=1202772 RepID=A0A1V9Z7U1_ACHHY|nr:transmembrane protein [Achlya hypogyna]
MATHPDPSVELQPDGSIIDTSETHFKDFANADSDPSTALAPGGALPLMSPPVKVFFGLALCSNFLQILMPPLNSTIYASYLHGSAYHVAQIASLQSVAWTFRVFFGILSDIAPVFGYRRKFWLVAGWLLSIGALMSMAFTSFGDPYCDPKEHRDCWNPKSNTSAYFLGGIGAVWARLFMQLGVNGKRYGGTYDFSAGPNAPYAVAVGFGLIGLGLSAGLYRDTKNHIKGLGVWFTELWALLANRAVYQFLAFRLMTSVFQSPTGTPIVTWVKNLDLGWANVIPRVPYIPTIVITMKKGMGWNWRVVLLIGTFSSIVLTTVPTFFVIWDVCRNDYFYMILFAFTAISTGVNTLIPGWAMVEVAGVGHEATIAAIYGTIKDLVVPITNRWRTYMTDSFPANLALLNDDATQNAVGNQWIVCMCVQLAGLAFIFLLPTQRQPLLDMKRAKDADTAFKPHVDMDAATAIAPGGPVALKSRPAIVYNVLAIVATFLQNTLPPLNNYIFATYLHGSPLSVAQLASLQSIAWTLRVTFAVASDFVEFRGYRRKLWLILGWVIVLASVGSMAFSSFGAPFCDPKDYPRCRTSMANTSTAAYDLTAPSRVAWYRVPTLFATLGMAMVQASLDGVLVEFAHREPVAIRGHFQIFACFLSGIGGLLSRVFLQFCVNGKRYGGTYDWSAGPNAPYAIAFGMSIVALVVTVCLFHDTLNHVKDFPSWLRELGTLLSNRAVYQLLAFRLLTSVFQSPTGTPILIWVTNLDLGWVNVVTRVPFVPTMIITLKKGMGWNWRIAVFVTTAAGIVLTAIPTLFVIWDVCRNAYFYSILIALTAASLAMNTIMPAWAMVEVAGVGHEATTFAFYATIKDLVVPITACWKKFMTDSFPANIALKNDPYTRNQIGYTWIVCLAIQVVGLVFIALLPTHRKPLIAMVVQNDKSRVAAALVGIVYVGLVAFVWQQAIHNY